MKPSQIVGGFTYGGTVLDEAREGGSPGPDGSPEGTAWPRLRALVAAEVLNVPRPWLSAPAPAALAGLCGVCRGPAARGRTLCFQCDLHRECAQASLAELVVPAAFAIKGGRFAGYLWQYKSARPPQSAQAAAGRLLGALLLIFLRDHGRCLWQAAGIGGPTQLAVVPTGRGRLGPHPLRLLVQDYLDLSWAGLTARPGQARDRDLDPARYAAEVRPGASVLLLDDTWTTGSSAQSAAMALRQAGARTVVTVVLGRHVSRPAAQAAGLTPAAMAYRPDRCAVHEVQGPVPDVVPDVVPPAVPDVAAGAAPDAVLPSPADHRLGR